MRRTAPERFGELLFYLVLLLVGYLAYLVTSPFLASLAWAGILAVTLEPVRASLNTRLGRSRAALVTTLLTARAHCRPVAVLISMLAAELPMVVDFAQQLPERATPERVQTIWDGIRRADPGQPARRPDRHAPARRAGDCRVPRASRRRRRGEHRGHGRQPVRDAVRAVLPDARRRSGGGADSANPAVPGKGARAADTETQDLVIASVGAGLAVAAVQGTIGGVTFWAMGLPAPVAWGVAIGICSLIPVVGATLVWVPVALWWLLSGAVMKALILAGIGAGVIGMVDNILRPIILSGRASVNGLVVFIGLLGGVGAFGFVGLVLGPIILVTAGTLIDALTRRNRPITPEDA